MLLYIYKLLTVILLPIFQIVIYYRIYNKKEDPIRYREKFAVPSQKRLSGKLIWFHVASIGEMKAIYPILERLSEAQINILITSATLTSSRIFETLKIKNAVHQFAPLDSLFLIRKFLQYWQPDLLVLAESEIWPNMVMETSKQCKIALINARMSDKSFKHWSFIYKTAISIFNNLSYIAPCSNRDYINFKTFSNKVSEERVNLKYCSSPLSYDPAQLQELNELFLNTKLFLCASTHKNEEEQILSIYPQLKEVIPNFSLIIVPRHPNRGEEILQLAQNISQNVALRSKNKIIKTTPDIYIADTIGELGLFYRLCEIAFIGGSLIKHGGQNMIEPARLNCCILSGPHYENFKEIVENFKENNAIIVVQNANDLAKHIIKLFNHPDEIKALKQNAYQLVNKNLDLADRITLNLKELITNDKA